MFIVNWNADPSSINGYYRVASVRTTPSDFLSCATDQFNFFLFNFFASHSPRYSSLKEMISWRAQAVILAVSFLSGVQLFPSSAILFACWQPLLCSDGCSRVSQTVHSTNSAMIVWSWSLPWSMSSYSICASSDLSFGILSFLIVLFTWRSSS